MRLRLGQPVATSDGHFGELADIVIDPLDRIVTHLVVDPEHRHHQARLVPLWLVSEHDGQLIIDLDTAHARELRIVAETDFVRVGESLDLGEDWDVGIGEVLALPYWSGAIVPVPELDDRVTVVYDRIPKGECEIRRESVIVSADDHVVGHVEGLLVENDDVIGVVTRRAAAGLAHRRVVPIADVAGVANDRIDLTITRSAFRDLPLNDEVFEIISSKDEHDR